MKENNNVPTIQFDLGTITNKRRQSNGKKPASQASLRKIDIEQAEKESLYNRQTLDTQLRQELLASLKNFAEDDEEDDEEYSEDKDDKAKIKDLLSIIDRKNKVLEELSRRHEHALLLTQKAMEKKQEDSSRQYLDRIEFLQKQMEDLANRNAQLEAQSISHKEETQSLQTKLKYVQDQLQQFVAKQKQTTNSPMNSRNAIIETSPQESALLEQLKESNRKLENLQQKYAIAKELIGQIAGRNRELEQEVKEKREPNKNEVPAKVPSKQSSARESVNGDIPVQEVKIPDLKQRRKSSTKSTTTATTVTSASAVSSVLPTSISSVNEEKQREMEEKRQEQQRLKEQENQRVKAMMEQVASETQKTLSFAKQRQKENAELREENEQLRVMGERYFAALRAMQESERKLMQKENQLQELASKYQDMQRLLKQAKKR